MGLFRKKSSSSTNSARIRKALKTPPPPPPPPPPPGPAPLANAPDDYMSAGNGNGSTTNGYSTPSSQLSNYTNPSDHISRSTTTLPSSIDDLSIRHGRSRNGSTSKTQPHLQPSGEGRRFSNASQNSEVLFDSRPSSMTITQRKPPPPLQTRPHPPSAWPGGNSPTPSESASIQQWYPRQPQQQSRPPSSQQRPPSSQYRPPSSQYRPPSSQQRPPLSPTLSRHSTFRSRTLPSLPENSHISIRPQQPSMHQHRSSAIPSTPGPSSIIISFSKCQIDCAIKHANLRRMNNFHHSVPCMVCRTLTIDGMSYCAWCSLRVCKDCTLKLQRDWDGDITKGWGVVELMDDGAGYTVQWGVHTRPTTSDSTNMLRNGTKSSLDRVSQLLGVMNRPDNKTPEFGFHTRNTSDETTSDPSTASPPSPITPPAFNTTLDLSLKPPSDFDAFSFQEAQETPVLPSSASLERIHPHPQPVLDVLTDSMLQNDLSRQSSYASRQTAYINPAFRQPSYDRKMSSTPSTITQVSSSVLPSQTYEVASSVKEKKGLRLGFKGMFSKKL